MKKLDTNALAQLLGLAGVMASLIFVGLQMKQTQQIALAAQAQDPALQSGYAPLVMPLAKEIIFEAGTLGVE